jgi:hypothetical protein
MIELALIAVVVIASLKAGAWLEERLDTDEK